MRRVYNAQDGQSIYDVCLATYGTQNLLGRLVMDNGWEIYTGKAFAYDDELVADELIAAVLASGGIRYATSPWRSSALVTERGDFIITEDNQIIYTE